MPLQSPFRLEINIISAQDLPPVSKMLRTFAVAYVNPEHKLTTRIDHQGHTNPTWNYKVVFYIDNKFLMQDSSSVTIEIYNLAWLRDLPIGTARLLIGNLSPPLHKNPSSRRVALQICRPSGHLRGTLNLGLQLVSNIPDPEMRLFMARNGEEIDLEEEVHDQNEEDFQGRLEKNRQSIMPKNQSVRSSPESRVIDKNRSEHEPEMENRPESEQEAKTPALTSCGSLFSGPMRALPSEVAADFKRGFYSTDWNDYGSSIFEDWTEGGDKSVAKSRKVNQWPVMEDQIPLAAEKKGGGGGHHRPRRSGKKKGLLSCFGKAYGFQFSFICGSKTLKKRNKNRNVNKQNVHLMTLPKENLHRFYV